MSNTPPDRLSINPRSPFFDEAVLERGIGVRFKGIERNNVEEYCISEGWVRLGLTGEEIVTIRGLSDVNIGKLKPRQDLWVELFRPSDGKMARFPVRCRIDNQTEMDYLLAGGVMPYVLRNLARGPEAEAPAAAE